MEFLAAIDPTSIIANIRAFLTPVYLLIVGVVAIRFMMKRQVTQLLQFLGLAILVGALLFSPEIVQGLIDWGKTFFGAAPSA